MNRFLEEVGNTVHDLLCSNDANNYRGLDADRDTKEQVETMVRSFPEVLSKRGGHLHQYSAALQTYLYNGVYGTLTRRLFPFFRF